MKDNNFYIDYQQAEELLKYYTVLVAIVNSLQVELQAAYIEESENSDGDVIYALVMGNRKMDGMPKPPYSISDKTCNVALIYKQSQHATANAKVKRITKDMLEINTVLEKLDIAIHTLDAEQKHAVERFYLNQTYVVTSSDLRKERRIKKDKRNALDDVARVIRLPVDMYYNLMDKYNLNKRS